MSTAAPIVVIVGLSGNTPGPASASVRVSLKGPTG
jgi:hypothetical protein